MAVKISRILHAGYVFESEGGLIAFDPIFENPFSRNCYAFPSVQFNHEQIKQLRFDAVFISHFHDDHCSLESINLLDRSTPIYMYCIFDELFEMIRGLGFKNVYALTLNQPVIVGDIEIIPRRALDADVDSLFQIKVSGLNILNVVDSWIDPETLDLLANESSAWDMILWPFQTMRELEVIAPRWASPAPTNLPPEWIEQLKILNPKYIVPSSCQFIQEEWSWYNHAFFPITYRQFAKDVTSAIPSAEIVRMNPSVSVVLNENTLRAAPALAWISPIGNQDVDYDYRPHTKPLSTAEIAKRFSALNKEQEQLILRYCQSGLLEKYSSLDEPLDPYFHKRRLWKLSVFDYNGTSTDFYYSVKSSNIAPANADEGPLAWATEVPAAKLYAALELGESLTSMYVRINDCSFDCEIENLLPEVDIIEDPLIRCLFTGAIGSYQRAQLKRLTS